MPLPDQIARDRFATEIDTNFGISASAGGGKTTALVSRIATMAEKAIFSPPDGNGVDPLSRIVVITFGKLAAEEIRVRARAELFRRIEERNYPRQEALSRFNLIYFGTIHSFFLSLLREHGHKLGLSSDLDLLDDNDDSIWGAFAESDELAEMEFDPGLFDFVSKHVTLEKIYLMGKRMPPSQAKPILAQRMDAAPELDIARITEFVPNKRNAKTVPGLQAEIAEWYERAQTSPYSELPAMTKGGAEFVALCDEVFAPYKQWLGKAVGVMAAQVCQAYQQFRISRSKITYDDMIDIVHQIVGDREMLDRLRLRDYRVLLDEAQDTDGQMFEVLVELTRPGGAMAGLWPDDSESAGPRPGRLSFVGDNQQSIHSSRADISVMAKYLAAYSGGLGGERLDFTVTMRCPSEVTSCVNSIFPKKLDHGVVAFKPLDPNPGNTPQGACALKLPFVSDYQNAMEDSVAPEIESVAEWIAQQGKAGLKLSRWSDLAILIPRNGLAFKVRSALEASGLPVQQISTKALRSDLPGYSWPTALLYLMVHPEDRHELIGILRDIYGVSDRALLKWQQTGEQGVHLAKDPCVTEICPVLTDAISDLCNLRAALRDGWASNGLGSFVSKAFSVTRLQERLVAAGYDAGPVQEILSDALKASAEGQSLEALVDALMLKLVNPPSLIVQDDAICLLSCHKSKGLQWPVVIPVGMGVRLKYRPQPYPRVEMRGKQAEVFLDGSCVPDLWRDAGKTLASQEALRLYYVTMTRATRTLICPDGGSPQSGSLLDLSQAAGVIEDLQPVGQWEAISSSIPQPADPSPVVTISPELPDCPANPDKLERVLPHMLVDDDRPTQAPIDSDMLNLTIGGVEYGVVFHELMESAPWHKGRNACLRSWVAGLRDAPQFLRERLDHEIHMLAKCNEVWQLIEGATSVITEMPFLVCEANRVIEGFIDMVIISDDGLTVLDWKTNRGGSTPDEFATWLSDHYQPQLDAYGKALASYGRIKDCRIYSSSAGTLI